MRILEDLTIRRAETLDWLHARHFAGLSRKRALNRLGDLAAHGYLERVPVELPWTGEMVSAYTFGPRAKQAVIRRSLAAEHFLHRRWNPILREDSIPHQLAVNRVADWLGADLLPEHLLETKDGRATRHRPDGTYQLAAHASDFVTGEGLVYLEVDLGHYTRRRIIEKASAFLASEGAKHLLIVCPTERRASNVRHWLAREMPYVRENRLTVLTLAEVRDQPDSHAHLEPAPPREHYAMPDMPMLPPQPVR